MNQSCSNEPEAHKADNLEQPNEYQLHALQQYANTHGGRWKSKLCLSWETGRDESLPNAGLLRQVRNEYGPRWLNSKLNTIRPQVSK